MEDEIKRLRSQVKALQEENHYLKRLLEETGIPYVRQPEAAPVGITRQLARRFYSYFWGRMDVYSKRSVNKSTGKSGYYPQCENLWKDGLCPKKIGKKVRCKDCANRKWKALEAEQIMAHLRGEKPDGSDVIGVYPLFPDGSCRFLVFDFDNHEKGAEVLDFGNTDNRWMEEVDALRQVCGANGIPCLVERSRSGRGGHLWIFFDNPVEAGLVRRFGMALLEKGAETVNLKSFRFYDRMLPAQTSISDGELGYLFFAGAAAAILSYRLTRPLGMIKETALELAAGHYDIHTGITTRDEIGQLAQTMDVLAEHLEKARKEREQIDRMRSSFVANVSHELRTPIAILRGYLELLEEGTVTDREEIQGYFRQMLSESRHMERLVNDLLELSRLQDAGFRLTMEEVDLCSVVSDAARAIRRQAQSKHIDLEVQLPEEECRVMGDYGRIRQLLMILLDNAVKFS